jgi:hypothetical protein
MQGQEAITCWQHCIQLYQTALSLMPPGSSSFELEFNLGTACMHLAGRRLPLLQPVLSRFAGL